MRRLLLLRHARTDAVRRAAFGADEPLDEAGRAAAALLRGRLPRRAETLMSPALRARQTAEAVGLEGGCVETALRECDFGRWSGRSLAEVHAAEPDAARAWMTDPAAAPHGGESLLELWERTRVWLDEQAERPGAAVAVTHGGVIKAAVAISLGAPPEAVWRIDAAPLAVTELHAHDGRWTVVRANASVGAGEGARVDDESLVRGRGAGRTVGAPETAPADAEASAALDAAGAR